MNLEEYRHLLEHVTLWDVGVERIVEIRGPDGALFINRLTHALWRRRADDPILLVCARDAG